MENNKLIKNGELTKRIKNAIIKNEMAMKELKAKNDELKMALKDAMETNNIKKFESDELIITYIEPTTRESFDSRKFKAEHIDLYDEYVKISDVKSSVRIKVK